MPGPSNSTRRRSKGKPNKPSKSRLSIESASSSSTYIRTPSPVSPALPPKIVAEAESPFDGEHERYDDTDDFMPPKPFIHDPGNGHRVRDIHAFLSSFFAQPPALDDPLCAEFSQDEVLQMLCTVLPEETALILWYNKSRSTSRVCPACQRLYRLGDVLPELTDDDDEEHPRADQPPSPQLEREQEISGLCSALCFILASYNYPAAISSAWGHMAEEMNEEAWTLLNSGGDGNTDSAVSAGLGMLVRMTRLHDLGLAQLCLPDVDDEDLVNCDETFLAGHSPLDVD